MHTSSPRLPHVSEERIIDVKSFEFLETKEWDKYSVLITMIISGTRKVGLPGCQWQPAGSAAELGCVERCPGN